MNAAITSKKARNLLDPLKDTKVPGIQYVVMDADRVIFDYAEGWADIRNHKPMLSGTTQMAYSMTKTFTAAAILQLVEKGKLKLEDKLHLYLPDHPYDQNITIRHLLTHTSGIPNPIPLRWAHLVEMHEAFDEKAALAQVLRANPRTSFEPGRRYAYSNIGYWLLGQVIEEVTRQSFIAYMKENVIKPLRTDGYEMDFVITDPSHHAKGYLARYSMMNLVKGFVTDRIMWGPYEGKWLHLNSHYVNGPAFGGLLGPGRGFGRFLQDQLKVQSVLLSQEIQQLFYTQQKNSLGEAIEMTLGWHVGEIQGVRYYFKEGGGGGFHSEMRLYPTKRLASVVMVNSTQFNSNAFLSNFDKSFWDQGF